MPHLKHILQSCIHLNHYDICIFRIHILKTFISVLPGSSFFSRRKSFPDSQKAEILLKQHENKSRKLLNRTQKQQFREITNKIVSTKAFGLHVKMFKFSKLSPLRKQTHIILYLNNVSCRYFVISTEKKKKKSQYYQFFLRESYNTNSGIYKVNQKSKVNKC